MCKYGGKIMVLLIIFYLLVISGIVYTIGKQLITFQNQIIQQTEDKLRGIDADPYNPYR